MRLNILTFCLAIIANAMSGQSSEPVQAIAVARDHLARNAANWGLANTDIAEMRISSSYTSGHNGVTHVYMVQQYQGADIEKATYNCNIQDGEVVLAFQKLVPSFEERIRSSELAVTPQRALSATAGHFGQELRSSPNVVDRPDANRYIFERAGISRSDMPTDLVYTKLSDGSYLLTWKVMIEPVSGQNLYSVYIDAGSGKVVRARDLSLSCNFPHTHSKSCSTDRSEFAETKVTTTADGAQYFVIPVPFESPNHVERRMVTDPADPDASPFGWHDINGEDGAEYTITFGNNVHAFADRDGDFSDNEVIVDGGADLQFVFPFPQHEEPEMYQPAAVTNLFYMNNVMHDFAYHYGFTEDAGNFQETNYSSEGQSGDNVRALAQFGAGTSSPPTNNAVFSTPRDGINGRMRMYIWEGDNQLLRVDEPGVIAGKYSTGTTTDSWGAVIDDQAVTGEVAIVNDGTGTPTLGCLPLTNGDDIDGKIALIDRGACDFGCKALYAQDAGAIGFVICNVQEGLVTMAPGECGAQVTIPGVFLSSSDCQTIRAYVDNGLVVSLVSENDTLGPSQRSGSFDNSIIAHEYGHGISNRLTFGPLETECLQNYDNDGDNNADNGEQMGEGWSDFFSLVTTVKSTDDAMRNRSIASYADNQDTTGLGIRTYPYTVDMNVNPLTYDDIAFSSVPHGVGTVWCAMLWDLYWALTDRYGFDPDLYRGNGGNNLAIQLVMDGMKLQPCQPTFIEGRDAILAADQLLTGGENQQLIWEVFARRGLGYSAESGDESSRSDGKEAFDVKADEVPTVKLQKEMTPWIDGGDNIDVSLTVHNHKNAAATSVVLSDVIPEGTEIIPGSASMSFSEQGDMAVFELGTLQPMDTLQITYQLATSPNIVSDRYFFDDIEEGVLNWAVTSEQGSQTWKLEEEDVYSGSNAWTIEAAEESADASLFNIESFEVTGEHPVLVFRHKFATERFYDAGTIFISNTDGFTWDPIPFEQVVRSRYTGKLPFSLFALPDLRGWHGESNGWETAVLDLSGYAGEEIRVRFRFASNDVVASNGWTIDDIELLDLRSYNAEACLTSAELDNVCEEAVSEGTFVNFGILSSNEEVSAGDHLVQIYPNPASDHVTLDITGENAMEVQVRLIDTRGRIISSQSLSGAGNMVHRMDVSQCAPGIYFVSVAIDGEAVTSRICVF